MRKFLDRVFGVLFRQFEVLFKPSESWTTGMVLSKAKARVIIHNMDTVERTVVLQGMVLAGSVDSVTKMISPLA